MYSELISHGLRCIYVYLLFTNQVPSEADMEWQWLNTSRTPADIYAVGIQEIDAGYEILLNVSINQSPLERTVSSVIKKVGSLRSAKDHAALLYVPNDNRAESLSRHIIETAGILANRGGVGELSFALFASIVSFFL